MFELTGYSNFHGIGAGGQAKVYAATHDAFQRQVAVKVLLTELAADPAFVERFLREARIVAGLVHPHIVPVYDFGQRDGTLYMVMEHLAGGDLRKKIDAGLKLEDILKITSQIALALNFAHEKGFIHRDVKPDNVLFREDGSAVLTDFGIARKQDAANQLTIVGQILGTPRYMSPEQLQDKQVDGRTDIYSLGIMFYQMCTGRAPYEDKDFTALAMKHVQAPIPKLLHEFSKYQRLFERMVAKEPEKRFQTGMEVVTLIEQIRSGKVDAASIISGEAAALKRSLAQAPQPSSLLEEVAASAKGGFLPREVLIALQDLDPLLDENWKKSVSDILAPMKNVERKYIYSQFLQQKGIVLDPVLKQLVFPGRPSVQDISRTLKYKELITVAARLEKAQQILRTATDIPAFADMMEGGLSLIDAFDSREDLKAHKEKNTLRAAYLDDLVLIVRGANFLLPENRRSLTIESIKAYIIGVYIKQQMLGYRFKAIPASVLELNSNAFIKKVVAVEAKLRQCDVVKFDKYYFLIGPARNSGLNPYSVRRFLQEDSAMQGKVIYFNVAVILVDAISNLEAQKEMRWVLSRIVTLEKQISSGIVELMTEMDKAHREQLAPMLSKPIDADGTEIERAIVERLNTYEKTLSILVLGKLPKGVLESAQSTDDYEYLFFSVRRFIIELACDVRDFSAQSTTMWSTKAKELDLRMMAYLRMLDKRKATLFSTARAQEPESVLDVTLPEKEFTAALQEHEPQIKLLELRLKEVLNNKGDQKSGFKIFLDKLFKADVKKLTPEEVQMQIDAAKHKCLIALIKIRKRFPVITVYLEFEDLVEVNEAFRHYALPAGREGLARLPILVTLPEDKAEFSIDSVREAIGRNIFKMSGPDSTGFGSTLIR